MAPTIQVRGEGGGVFTLDIPLHEALVEQLEKGTLTVLDAEGNPTAYDPGTVSDAEPGDVEAPAEPPAGGDEVPPSGDALVESGPPSGNPDDSDAEPGDVEGSDESE